MKRSQTRFCCLASICLALLSSARLAFGAAVATPEELQSMFDQGKYTQLLPPLNVALAALTDKTADPGKKYKLLMLKGETMLRTKASAAAQDSFHGASLVPGIEVKEIALAKANVSLIKRSGNSKYQPKTKDPGSTAIPAAIDIIMPDSRKEAFAALFVDLLEPAKPIVARGEAATTLEPIIDCANQLSELRPIEFAATGSDVQSKALLTKLATHASDLMTAALKTLGQPVPDITKSAAKKMGSRGGSMTVGLTPQNDDKLGSIITQAREMSSAAADMQVTFGDIGNFKSIKSEADKLVEQANNLLQKYKKPTE